MYKCHLCQKSHKLEDCFRLKNQSIDDRWKTIKNLKVCQKCFGINHVFRDCRKKKCSQCPGKHHVLLHRDFKPGPQPTGTTPLGSVSVHASCSEVQVLLSTAIVGIQLKDGSIHKVRALIDNGSQSNFISQEVANKLGLQRTSLRTSVTGIHEQTVIIDHAAQVNIVSLSDFNYRRPITCLILKDITQDLPQCRVNRHSLSIPSRLRLADPNFDRCAPVDMLLGAGIFWEILKGERVTLGPQKPILQRTLLGWILGGELRTFDQGQKQVSCAMLSYNLDSQIERFWRTEDCEPPQEHPDTACESHFLNTVSRDTSGSFVVRIPWKEEPNVGSSLFLALQRLYMMERRFLKDPELKAQYIKFMLDYERLGHMQRCQPDHSDAVFYLPHHAVFKDNKIRVVYDGSVKTKSGQSINDKQFTGPTVQRDIFSILVGFRWHSYVLVGDIEKMYRGIKMDAMDQNFQRIVWRETDSEEVTHFKLTTVTYGMRSSAFLATRCLIELSNYYNSEFPLAAKAIKSDFYVDDLLTGHDDLAIVNQLKDQLIHILNAANLRLTKWKSNVPALSSTPTDENCCLPMSESDNCKVLGLHWTSSKDTLTFRVSNLSNPHINTKRNILSNICKIYDPLGLLAPVILNAKLLIQELWKEKVDWDETPSATVIERWKSFQQDILNANCICVPRCIKIKEAVKNILIGFSDASEGAFSGIIYLRSTSSAGEHSVKIVCAKTKVAPIKELTIPRLELCGALLLTKLMNRVQRALDLQEEEVYMFTDSTIVLCWLKADPSRWNTFVANRVREINSLGPTYIWNHISSKQNPADVASRGCTTNQLLNNSLWWEGPNWFSSDQRHWPHTSLMEHPDPPELKSGIALLSTNEPEKFELFEKYSSFTKLLRVTAFINRFVFNLRNPQLRKTGILRAAELDEAHDFLIKRAQKECFASELKALNANAQIPKKSKIICLNPFLHRKILHVGGRIRNSELEFSTKHPILLSSSHKLSELIIRHHHYQNLHCGPRTLLAIIRTRYWLVSGLVVIKKILKKCILCFRFKPKLGNQLMADLPGDRLLPIRPFSKVGCDFAGPIFIKSGTLRGSRQVKAYICLFVCLAVKAIHLELMSNLTMESFLEALRRFTSRRGLPTKIICDNAGTFKGTCSELNLVYDFLCKNEDSISQKLADQRIEWSFITPRAPHTGGIYESQIKQVKLLLKKCLMSHVLNYESMYTVLVQIEAILNSRPLFPMSDHPHDLEPLTPAHFLIHQPILTLPDPSVSKMPSTQLSHYKKLISLFTLFWERWSRGYLLELQRREKWNTAQPNIKIGQLVLLKDDGAPPLFWKLGRVTETLTSADGFVRSVCVKTNQGTLKRHIRGLAPLPIQEEQPNQQSGT
jgi:hypothetical protein